MIFTRSFSHFDFDEFYTFLRKLMEKHGFRNILFSPENIQFFTPEQLTHAAPDHDLSHPNSFIGQWKQNSQTVRSVKLRFTGETGTPDVEMTIHLDNQLISLDEARAIDPSEIEEALTTSLSKLVQIKQQVGRKTRARPFGEWKIVRNLSEGGQALTHLVVRRGESGDQQYVLKRLKNLSEQRLRRFEREVQAGLLLAFTIFR